MKFTLVSLIFSGSFLLSACAPKIYVVDRQTVLEQESAGDWPKFEDDLMGQAMAQGPTPFTTIPITASKARLYNVLNGELVAQPSDRGVPAANGKTTSAKGGGVQ